MSTQFVITVQQVVDAALRKLGVIVQGDNASATQTSEAILTLNIMVGRFFTLGLPIYREYKHIISTLVQGQAAYSVSPDTGAPYGGVWNVYQAFLKDTASNIEIPLRVVSRDEYNAMTNKTQQGTPVMVCMSPDGQTATFYLTPDAVTAAGNTVSLYGYKQEDTYTAGANNIVFPREWGEALIYGLALRLAPEYGTALDFKNDLEKDAKEALADAVMWNPEATSYYFGAAVHGRS